MHANQVERILVWCFSQTSQLLDILNKQTNNNIYLGSRIGNRNLIIFYMEFYPLILSSSHGSSMLLFINMFIFNFHLTSTCSPNYLFLSNPLIKLNYSKLHSNIRAGDFIPISAVLLFQSLYNTLCLTNLNVH